MDFKEVKEKLIILCGEVFQNSDVSTDLIEYVDFAEDLGMDSISFITLIVEIESLFDTILPDELLQMDAFRNINDVTQIVFNQLSVKSSNEDKPYEKY